MNILFLGGVFSELDKDVIVSHSKGSVQYAADTLQKNYIDGFCQHVSVETVQVINLPFLGAYPNRYKTVFFSPATEQELMGRARLLNIGFLNVTLIKNLHRLFLAAKAIFSQLKRQEVGTVLVCYSMHLPFLLACYVAKVFYGKKVHFCVIVPDLPEYMAVRAGLVKFVFHMLSRISYFVVNRADTIVAITSDMMERFAPDVTKVVIEGIADKKYISRDTAGRRGKYLLYTGTLDRRYGIRNLVDSFVASGVEGYELFICGDGDDRQYVETVAAMGSNIKYFGQLDRDAVLKLQRHASLLVNPRDNDSEYTRYSFPSKIIEYMSSGVPVLMYRLDGVPNDYYDYCYVVPLGSEGLAKKLLEVCNLNDEERFEMAASAKRFVTENKMPGAQVGKLLDAIKGNNYV